MTHTIGERLDVWKYREDAHLESEKPITERDGTILPESRTDFAGFFFFFFPRLPTGGCQSGDEASQTKPSIRFPSCKAQCDIVHRLFYKENMRWLRGGGETHLQELQISPRFRLFGEVGRTEGRGGYWHRHYPPTPHPSSTAVQSQREVWAVTACHRIVMSHSIRAPGPIRFKNKWKKIKRKKIWERTRAKSFFGGGVKKKCFHDSEIS